MSIQFHHNIMTEPNHECSRVDHSYESLDTVSIHKCQDVSVVLL